METEDRPCAVGKPISITRAPSGRSVYFSEAMVVFHGGELPVVAASMTSPLKTVVDVGGATGKYAGDPHCHAGPRGVLSTGHM